ncbi:MAG: MFS transporter [Pseudomonadales bacterium]|nr:MFS transporter [Pseudomonadales bacterium]
MNQSTLTWRLTLLSCLYFSQGLPFGFFSQALPPILRQYGVDLEKIGLISLIGVPWALKFLWAPYVDQFGSTRLGRHKSWILPMQAGFVCLLLMIAFFDPNQLTGNGLYYLLVLMFFANLFAATQDIATDGLAVQSLAPSERGFGNSIQVGGYRVGMVFGGGLILILIDRYGWQNGFFLMAAAIVIATLPVIWHREHNDYPVKGKAGAAPIWTLFMHFVRQPNMHRWLLVVIFYKAADSLGSAMGKPFLVDVGMDLETIGWVSGGLGMVSGIVGAVVGGILIPKIGRARALFYFGLIQATSFLGYGYLSLFESPSIESVMFVSTFEHFTGGMATVALFTAMMDVCRTQLAGTDYTIQASIQVTVGGLLHAFSGFIAGSMGYSVHFTLAFILGILVLIPVLWWSRSNQHAAVSYS